MSDQGYYRQDLFRLYLTEYIEHSPNLVAAALVAGDGFALASAGDDELLGNLDVLSALAMQVIQRSNANFSFAARCVTIEDVKGNLVVCRHLPNEGKMPGDFVLVIRCTAEYNKEHLEIVAEKIRESLEELY